MDTMDKNQVLYHLQHGLLPSWFYEEPKNFIGVLSQEPKALFEIASELFRRANLEMPYKAAMFSAEPGEVNENVMVLRIKFPKPDAVPLCHGALCFFDKSFQNINYFTLEKGPDLEGDYPILCSWSKDGQHFNLGSVSPDPDEQLVQCIDMYMGKFGDEVDAMNNQ